MLSQTAPKSNHILGYFCKKINGQKLSEIAQSGHTAVAAITAAVPLSQFPLHIRMVNSVQTLSPVFILDAFDVNMFNQFLSDLGTVQHN